MARTPLMRALQRLAREHREAEALGMRPAELRERQAEGTLSRKRSSSAAASSALR